MNHYLRLLKFVKPYLGLFSVAVVCMAFSAVFDGVSLAMMVPLVDKVMTNKQIVLPAKLPAFLGNIVTILNNTPAVEVLNFMAITIIILFVLKGLFGFLQAYFMSDIGQRVVRDIQRKLYAKIQFLSMGYFTEKRAGELMSRITNDVKLVENAVSYGSTDLIYQGLQVAIFALMAFFIYTKMALVVFIIFPLITLPIIKVGKVLRKLSRRSQEKVADINSLLYETIMGARIVKAFNMEDYEINKFNKENHAYYRISMKSIKRILLLSPFTEFLGALVSIFVLMWGGREVISGKISFGVFGAFLGCLLSLIRPFKKIGQVNAINQQAVAASIRIHDILDAKPTVVEKEDASDPGVFKDRIIFKGVWFSYADQEVLKDINLEVKKGQLLAVVGPSGAGKTTLLDLIPRFYDPQKGSILIDGSDIREYTLKSLRRNIGIVTQETILFNDTIGANIAYGKPAASKNEIVQAATQANAQDFIKELPQGYDTVIGDRGVRLSGGERQRISIARALLKDPPILILDEATSQLDSESERIVQEALEKLIYGRTVFVIAHRLSTVKNANKIIVLDKGRIVEEGVSHSDLLAQNGLYQKLYHLQELG